MQDLSHKAGNTFITKMASMGDPENTGLMYFQDVNNYFHLIEKENQNMNIIKNILNEFVAQSLKSPSYHIGLIMRAMIYLNNPDLALELIWNKNFKDVFNDWRSHTLLMVLL